MECFKSNTPLIEFLKNYCNSVTTEKGETWYYSPFWFSENKEVPELLKTVNFDHIPTELIDEIKRLRDGKSVQLDNTGK